MVCTVTKNSIEKRGENFREHVMEHHMFWKYLYFLTYLEGKNPEDYTGLENAIHEQFLKTQADWVPFEKESDEAEGEGEKKAIAAKPSADDKDSIKDIQDSTKAMSESIKTVEGKLKTLEGKFLNYSENLAKMEKSIAEISNQNIDKISEKVSEKIKTMIDALKLKPAN
jgi:septal ring factor EnvC (AmiA/AmiB activator)